MYLNSFVEKACKNIYSYPEPLEYLYSRAINDNDIDKFKIGYTRIANVPKSDTEDYTILSKSTHNFRGLQNKIIFPLRNVLGYVNGLTVRYIDKKMYMHYFLEESKKIGAFFGLSEALSHMSRTKRVFVHEGAFNAISFSKVFPNTIASLTSFLNEQQFEMLRFFVNKIILIYDKDKSGFIGVDKMREYYGTRYIDHVYIGDMDANAYEQLMGFDRFKQYIRTKIPSIYQEEELCMV